MNKILSLVICVVSLFAISSCNESDDISTNIEIPNIVGVWENVGDPNDVFTFYSDQSGKYVYSYLTETNPDNPDERFESTAFFNLYLIEEMESGDFELSLFADSDFPISNASFRIVDGYFKITYDWYDTEGHEKYGVVEAYRYVGEVE